MRLLVVNPNTSASVTRAIARAAVAAAAPGDVVDTVGAPFGPALIVTEEDGAVAAGAVVACVEARRAGYDGIVIASFGDTGIDAVRARVPVPVVGIARAAFLAALAVGERFSIVTFSPAVAPSLRAVVARYGLSDRLSGLHAPRDAIRGPHAAIDEDLVAPLADLCVRAQDDGCAAIVLGGGPLAGLAPALAPRVSVPVIDGVVAAVALQRALITPRPPR
ncbi:aspartate/glutamate racemase family protein [Salinarimonas chemoclinalis]|uniref:aspartate/glutamate racemase family protein n=1 Tax=Salinarimonas chemoclinalis TaxID=3241599 RepID=UPI003555D982